MGCLPETLTPTIMIRINFFCTYWKEFLTTLVVSLILLRLFYGLDFTDESFYLAIPYQFTLGAIPFTHETNITQTSGILLYPFIKLFTFLKKDTEGILLYARFLFLIASGIFSYVLYRIFRSAFSSILSFFVSLLFLLFIPFNIPALSYNSFAAYFLTLGLWSAWLSQREKPVWSAVSGLSLVFSCWVYPSFLIIFLYIGILLLLEKQKKNKTAFLVSSFMGLVFFSFLILCYGVKEFTHCIQVTSLLTRQDWSLSAFNEILNTWYISTGNKICVLFFTAFLFCSTHASSFYRLRKITILLFIIFFFFDPYFGENLTSLGYSIRLASFSCLWLVVSKRTDKTSLLKYIIIPSLAAGLLNAKTSTNGLINAGIGCFPAALLSLLLMGEFLEERLSLKSRIIWAYSPFFIVLIFLLKGLFFENAFFREDPFSSLTHKVERGPAKGIWTSPPKERYAKLLFEEMSVLKDRPGKISIYYLPYAYLMFPKRNGLSSIWTVGPPAIQSLLERSYLESKRDGNTFVWIRWIYEKEERVLKNSWNLNDPLLKAVSATIPAYNGKRVITIIP
jgi:hypothetical protein